MSGSDIRIALAIFALSSGLWFSVFTSHKPARWNCIVAVLALIVLVVEFSLMKYWVSVGIEIYSAVLWGVLLFQKRSVT